jgi:sporulation protein YlmC with PRC-barrel domain
MFTKKERGSGRIWWGVLMGMGVAAFFSLNGSAAEMKKGETKGNSSTESQQHEETMHFQGGVRASRIMDHSVMNGRGEELGEVDDLIMSRNGKIKKVILSVGGFLGIGDRLVAVPFKSLQIGEKGDIVYPVTRQQLENHPAFAYQKEGLEEFYYSPPPPYGSFEIGPPGYQGFFPYGQPPGSFPGGRYRGEYGAWGWEYYPERIRVSGILDRPIWNEGGQEVGRMDDLIIDRNGKVTKIILSTGEFLGMEEKLVVLPFRPLKVNGTGVVYDVTLRRLKELPGFQYQKR